MICTQNPTDSLPHFYYRAEIEGIPVGILFYMLTIIDNDATE